MKNVNLLIVSSLLYLRQLEMLKLLIPSILMAFLLLAPGSAKALYSLSTEDEDIYQEAFQLLADKRGSDAVAQARRATDPILKDVILGLYLGTDESEQNFETYQNFLDSHSNWPGTITKPIGKQAARHMEAELPANEVLDFFKRYPPVSDDEFRRQIAALLSLGRTKEAHAAIRKRWQETGMGEKEQDAFLHSFGKHITATDTFIRLDNMLWEGQKEQAKQLFKHLSPAQKKLTQARIALPEHSKKAQALLNAVPANLQNTPGLLYERIRWRFKSDDTNGAVALLEKAGEPSHRQEAWWNLRNRAVRELLQDGQYQRAYKLAQDHGVMKGNAFAEGEFLSGWIALRFLNQPAKALTHFERLYEGTTSPISLGRAAYWCGRAYETLNENANAQNWYRKAVVNGTTYYGQLAATKLYGNSSISAPAPALGSEAQSDFEDSIQAARIAALEQVGELRLAGQFALALAQSFTQEQQFRLLGNMAMEMKRGDIAVKVSKEAAKKQILLPGEGYPLLSSLSGLPKEQAALVHALIRQESEFDPNAVSSSNAQGLMQMLPSTAKHVSKKNGFGESRPNLFDAETNLRYGTAYVEELQENFEEYLPLVIASYNAGPNAVRGWLGKMGDPRQGEVDSIDWIESIPYSETRNYVQRVLEGLQVYRARLSGGSTLLALESDLQGR
jgi:soluble lytic murein transglycosylase